MKYLNNVTSIADKEDDLLNNLNIDKLFLGE